MSSSGHQVTHFFFYKAAFQLGGSQHVRVDDGVPPQVQGFMLPLVEFKEIPASPFL